MEGKYGRGRPGRVGLRGEVCERKARKERPLRGRLGRGGLGEESLGRKAWKRQA